jgi:hypothetical protein
MWRRLRNVVLSLKTYSTLSPDLRLRRTVNRFLSQRPALSLDRWYETFWHPLHISKPVVGFVYAHLKDYSGLNIARLCPTDRLEDDLHWSQVCWFDWDTTLCEDVWNTFHVDVSDCLLGQDFLTLADLITYLHQEIVAAQEVCNNPTSNSTHP